MNLLHHTNLYLASQAMQCLLHITDEELYPWHDTQLLSDGRCVLTSACSFYDAQLPSTDVHFLLLPVLEPALWGHVLCGRV